MMCRGPLTIVLCESVLLNRAAARMQRTKLRERHRIELQQNLEKKENNNSLSEGCTHRSQSRLGIGQQSEDTYPQQR